MRRREKGSALSLQFDLLVMDGPDLCVTLDKTTHDVMSTSWRNVCARLGCTGSPGFWWWNGGGEIGLGACLD